MPFSRHSHRSPNPTLIPMKPSTPSLEKPSLEKQKTRRNAAGLRRSDMGLIGLEPTTSPLSGVRSTN